MIIAEQVCSKCQQLQPIESFPTRKGRSKPSSVCIGCRRAYLRAKAAEYRKADPEKYRAKALGRYAAQSEEQRVKALARARARYTPRPRAPLPDERPCKTCGDIFPITEFQHLVKGKTLSRRNCKTCQQEHERQLRRQNPERYREIGRRYTQRHPEQMREKQRRYRMGNPHLWSAYARRDYLKFRERRLAGAKLYKKKNPDKYKVYHYCREALKIQAKGSFTEKDLKWKRQMVGDSCYYCHKPFTSTPHLEHKIALSRGGTNWPANLTYACSTCNTRKNAKSAKEFILFLKMYPS